MSINKSTWQREPTGPQASAAKNRMLAKNKHTVHDFRKYGIRKSLSGT